MRYLSAVVVLLGVVSAAPIQHTSENDILSQDSHLLVRSLIPLLRRMVVPIEPVRIKPPSVQPHPNAPEAPPLVHLGSPDAVTPGSGSETNRLTPDAPDTPAKPPTEKLPGSRLQEPEIPPRLGADECLFKRCVGTQKAGAKPTNKVDERYDRTLDEMTDEDILYLTQKKYLVDEHLFEPGAPLQKWDYSTIKNNEKTVERFETEVWPKMKEDLRREKGLNDWELNNILDEIKSPRKENILETMASPRQGAIVVRESWNRDYDLNRAFKKKDDSGNVLWERPAVDSSEEVRWSDMVMDNWLVSAAKAGVEPNTLRHIGRDNIVTEETMATLENVLRDRGDQNEAIISEGDKFFDVLSNTVHAKSVVQFMLPQYPELGPLKVTKYKVYRGRDGYDMMIEVAPPGNS